MKRLITLILLAAAGGGIPVFAETNDAVLRQIAEFGWVSPGKSNDLASLPDDELTVFLDGRQVEGKLKKMVLQNYRVRVAYIHPSAGIGAHVAQKDGKVVIINPLAESPAMKAGLMRNDVIAAIDDKSTEGMSLSDVVNRIHGQDGSTVTLSILRSGLAQPFEVNLTRAILNAPAEPGQTPHASPVKLSILVLRKDANLSPSELERMGVITNVTPRETGAENR